MRNGSPPHLSPNLYFNLQLRMPIDKLRSEMGLLNTLQMTLEMKEKIHLITEDVEYKVGKALSEEIRRLAVLVDEFNDPFHPDPLVLNVYKSKMNNHIESGVGSNLKSRLSSDLQTNMESHQQEMIERMTALLPVERQQMSRNILPRREAFEVTVFTVWSIWLWTILCRHGIQNCVIDYVEPILWWNVMSKKYIPRPHGPP